MSDANSNTEIIKRLNNHRFNFGNTLSSHNIDLTPKTVETLQVNITKMCNQACLHCHVNASPSRTENMDLPTIERCLAVLGESEHLNTIDITGGAPELNPHFEHLVRQAKSLDKHVIVRHNLTVTIDGHPKTGEGMRHLPEFFKEHDVELISSLPYYREYLTDKQRGTGVFQKSIESIKMLNDVGYGLPDSGLMLNFVYNPVGPYLPPDQKNLEIEYKRELNNKFGISFNQLYTITNMPIHRFGKMLKRLGGYEEYMEKLVSSFNPAAADGVMCRSQISVGYDGKIYDCDFNQMLDMQIRNGRLMTVFDFDPEWLNKRKIMFGPHCFGCTAGAGSSCGGAIA